MNSENEHEYIRWKHQYELDHSDAPWVWGYSHSHVGMVYRNTGENVWDSWVLQGDRVWVYLDRDNRHDILVYFLVYFSE